MRGYVAIFTDGTNPRRTIVAAPDIEFARMKARSLVNLIMARRPFGEQDWSKWSFVVLSNEEGRREERFLN
jgi:hypothetical protein